MGNDSNECVAKISCFHSLYLYFHFTFYFRFLEDAESIDNPKCAILENPKNEMFVLENRTLTMDDEFTHEQGEFIQISPQRVRLKLRLGQKKTLTFKVAQAKKYPVDLYYLMDLSNSMSDDKDTIVSNCL